VASAGDAFELLSLALRPTSVREDAPQLPVAAHESGLEKTRGTPVTVPAHPEFAESLRAAHAARTIDAGVLAGK
jgi:hypothetical protein